MLLPYLLINILVASSINIASSLSAKTKFHVITGASGYIGREIVHTILDRASTSLKPLDDNILCLVRDQKVKKEQNYWNKHNDNVQVHSYDMLDDGTSLCNALNTIINSDKDPSIIIYHTASIFQPTSNPIETAYQNVNGTAQVFEVVSKFSNHQCNIKIILTSSMAAVRGTNQIPNNEKYYTYLDWNTVSQLSDSNWGACYQWSKMKSEQVAWELSQKYKIPLVTLCPSFVFGPIRCITSKSSFAVQLVESWFNAKSKVQSRLFVDVRDVARAHVLADLIENERLIVSTQARVSGEEIKDCLVELTQNEDIDYDKEYKGGIIPIGEQEVQCLERLKEKLGMELEYNALDTISDMAHSLQTLEE